MRHYGANLFRLPGLAIAVALLASAVVFGVLTSDRAGAYFGGSSGSEAMEKLQVGGGTGPEFAMPLGIVTERDGTLMVVDSVLNAVIRVEPSTGNRFPISTPESGSGPDLVIPQGIAIAGIPPSAINPPDATVPVVVSDAGLHAIVAIDPETEDRTIVSGPEVGSGPDFIDPQSLVVLSDGAIAVADRVQRAVIWVEPISGDRTIISGPNVGTGPEFINPMGIAVDADDSLLVVDEGLRAVLRVDPETGNRAIISTTLARGGGSIGSGPAFLSPVGITFETSDRPLIPDPALGILVVDAAWGVIRVDPETGDRVTISGPGAGSGPEFVRPRGIAVALGTDIVVTDIGLDAVVWVDPENGNRTILSR